MEPQDTFSGTVDKFTYLTDEIIATKIQAFSQNAYGVPKQKIIKEIEDYYIQLPKQRTQPKMNKTTKTATPKMTAVSGNME